MIMTNVLETNPDSNDVSRSKLFWIWFRNEHLDFLHRRVNESRARMKFPPKGNTIEQRAMTEFGN